MDLYLDKVHNNKIMEAIAEFDLIKPEDNVLVALSGGKDSAFLLYALKILSRHTTLNFTVDAVTVDLGFKSSNHLSYLQYLSEQLEVNLKVIDTDIYKYILKKEENNPCAKCAHFKKGALVNYMKNNGYKKLAFGHHYDDAIETFLISILYSGQLKTLQPKRYLSKNKVFIIRPLIYLREKRIVSAKSRIEFDDSINKCPYEDKTKRQEIKELLKEVEYNKQIFYNIASAMREDSPREMWPTKPAESELLQKINNLWKSN